MALLGAAWSGGWFCVETSGGPSKITTDARLKKNVLFVADHLKTAALFGNVRRVACFYSESWDVRLVRSNAGFFSRQNCLWRLGISFYPSSPPKKYRFISQSTRRVAKGDNWRSEFREATETRSLKVSKSVNAPANLTSNPQNGCSSGLPKIGPTVENDDLEAARLPLDKTSGEHRSGGDVKVIGVGARACAILNFCQQTSILPSAQFWMYGSDSALQNVQLSDHLEDSQLSSDAADLAGKQNDQVNRDKNLNTLYLVLGAGTGAGLGTAPMQLAAARSKGWLAVGIFIQPFMFEGQKRLEQANQLVENLVDCTDLVLVVEQDALLRGEAVTVSDATEMANNAVLMSISAISDIQSGKLDVNLAPEDPSSTADDRRKSLQNTGKAWLGSGKGHNLREAIEKSLGDSPAFDSPFVGGKVSVICAVASVVGQTKEELIEAESVLRQMLGSEIQLIAKAIINPSLEQGVILATVIIRRVDIGSKLRGGNIVKNVISLSTEVSGRDTPSRLQSSGTIAPTGVRSASSGSPSRENLQEGGLPNNSVSNVSMEVARDSRSFIRQEAIRVEPLNAEINAEESSSSLKESRKQHSRSSVKKATVRSYRTTTREEVRKVDSRQGSPQAPLASSASKRSWLALGWESGPSSAVAEAWAQARAEARRPAKVVPVSNVALPVGVRLRNDKPQVSPFENYDYSVEADGTDRWAAREPVPVDPDAVPRNRMMDMGLGAVMDMYNAASALVLGKETTDQRNKPSLTQRASSMLESERSQKKLTPMVEMEFKNGTYRGRCLTGLPDGKGRLTFPDGGFYDGQWKQGKRAGAGAFYYANGDLFQGSWKDDVMHGKGWMYYHNGDRLYANFWKGKAHGEGRFYAAQGDVFFGQFRENWRHGECLHIEASGVRWAEIWENGIFISRTPDDS
ncbi:hypothetical protein MPTK1_5g20670 [Marchantia polymorpha subsp. ruderalis]|uniref:Tubulin/FtsZ GTPase domain-containing protein n=2 Tax=Marchantia polymorpha TaxID=3197 RepID=A0AAF6BKH1_MARPO|nr:hypothetical protein MARPO_0058s0047 [Marchantia polymorpha]BBN12505.1 hypothetical protein Mp_5g20670 [Marchantia polymorpha subsp. ruderalis]|eukprot:PTQ37259.1 hypothetical protein MARPO_0058s0047 [Marchantia polymorpha]